MYTYMYNIYLHTHDNFKLTQLVIKQGIKVGLGISRANADSQWNPVYKAFHRIHRCGDTTIRQ